MKPIDTMSLEELYNRLETLQEEIQGIRIEREEIEALIEVFEVREAEEQRQYENSEYRRAVRI